MIVEIRRIVIICLSNYHVQCPCFLRRRSAAAGVIENGRARNPLALWTVYLYLYTYESVGAHTG